MTKTMQGAGPEHICSGDELPLIGLSHIEMAAQCAVVIVDIEADKLQLVGQVVNFHC